MGATDQEMDPEAAAAVDEILERGLPPWHSLSVPAARRLEDEIFSAGTGPEMDAVTTFAIPGPGGELPVRVYRPDSVDPGIIVFLHGGGWTLGTLDSADDICRSLAAESGAIVLSVAYRLAPEDPFPAALEDAGCAVEWVRTFGDRLGGDPDRIGVAGTSAGGNLAAATARLLRNDVPDLRGQFLLYPITDCAFDSGSYERHADAPLLSRADMRWFWKQYLRSPIDRAHPAASVLLAPEFEGVAPATVVTAGIDVLADEGRAYADALENDGVDVDRIHRPRLPHGFLSLADRVPAARDAMDELGKSIRDRLD